MTALVFFCFICPTTDFSVQHWLDEDDAISDNEYEVVACPACTKVHLINRKTGMPLVSSKGQQKGMH
jgi:hypothetical protein